MELLWDQMEGFSVGSEFFYKNKKNYHHAFFNVINGILFVCWTPGSTRRFSNLRTSLPPRPQLANFETRLGNMLQ